MSLRTSCCCLLLALAYAAPLRADTEYCVTGPITFQNALDQAEIDGDDSLIKVQSGSYALTSNLVYNTDFAHIVPAGRLTIRGGYNVGCSEYSLTPGATTLTSGSNAYLMARTSTGSVSVAGLTFQGAHLRLISPVLSACPSQRRSFAVRRVRIDQAMLETVGWCHHTEVENTLITNAVRHPDAAGFVAGTGLGSSLPFNDEDYESASNLTVINSSVVNGLVQLRRNGDAPGGAYLYNSIFSWASGDDILAEAFVFARHNRYDGITFSQGGSLLAGSGNNVSSAPQLDAGYVPMVGSAMVNSGTSVVPDGLPGTDLAGNERVIGSSVDRGAMESPFDGSGIYTVTNTSASGAGSLAQALTNANADSGFNIIKFNIAGSCPRVIPLAAAAQVRDAVLFDGWSQPGSVTNTSENGFNAVPCVVLSGSGGIGIEAMGQIGTGRISVRGLAFQGFDLAISLPFGEGHQVYGNQFGGRIGASGPILTGNGQAVALIGGGQTVIGGNPLNYRNLIGDSSDVGVLITTFLGLGGNNNSVINNLIGVGKTGSDDLGNGTGIRVNGGGNLIRGNRIGRNLVDGILLSGENAQGNHITDNHIGGGASNFGSGAANGRMGVMVQSDAHDNAIGPDNEIGRNGDDGVRIMPTAGGRNTVTANRIARNTALGLDLGANGVSDNNDDPSICDPEFGCAANRGQNFPILADAVLRPGGVLVPIDAPIRVQGTLRSTTGGPYRIELFRGDACDANGHGEGQIPIAAKFLTIPNAAYCPPGGSFCFACTNLNCTAAFTAWLPEAEVAVGDVITATATSASGDTSEFSACVTVTEAPNNDLIFANGFQ